MSTLCKLVAVILLLSAVAGAQCTPGPNCTPNIGLNTPAYNTGDWNTLLNENFTWLDSYLSGSLPLPNLSIVELACTGTVVSPPSCTAFTLPPGNNTTGIATTAFVTAAVAAATAGVSSFNTRTGAVVPVSGDYTVAQVTGAAPLASPTFTGNVQVNGTAIQIVGSTPAFILDGSEGGGGVAYIKENTDHVGILNGSSVSLLDLNLSSGVLSADGTNPILGVTPSSADNSTKVATTAYVQAQTGLTGERVLYNPATNVQVSGTGTGNQLLHTYTFGASTLATVGKSFRVHSQGDVFSTANTSETIALSISWQGTATPIITWVPTTTTKPSAWTYDMTCTVYVTGVSGALDCAGMASVTNGGYGGGSPFPVTASAVIWLPVNYNTGSSAQLSELISFTTGSASNVADSSFTYTVYQSN